MRRFLQLSALFVAVKLIDRIEILMLDARVHIEFFRRKARVYVRLHGSRARIAVRRGGQQLVAHFVKQNIIHAPGVDGDRLRQFAERFAFCDAGLHLAQKVRKVPHKIAVFVFDTVVKAVDLFKLDLSVVHAAENVPSGGRADIHGKEIGHGKVSFQNASGVSALVVMAVTPKS